VWREGTVLHDYAVVGIGSVVVTDVGRSVVVAGNPARTVGTAHIAAERTPH
jgi:acetyltransferase-like isoleucine patch superfamily enzyme